MIRGIQFKIPNKWGYMLKDILKNIDLADYDFEINDDNEIWMENNEQLFVEDIIDGEDFNKLICQNPYYIIFANIHIYKTGSKISKIKTYKEFSTGYIATRKSSIITLFVVLVLLILCIIYRDYQIVITFGVLFGIFALLIKVTGRNKIQYKRYKSLNNNEDVETNIKIGKDKIVSTSKKGDVTTYEFSQITNIVETKNLIILKLKYNMGIILNKNNIEGGTKEDLINYLYSVCNNLKKKKVTNTKGWLILRRIMFGLLVITVILSVVLSILKQNQMNNYVKLLEQNGYEIEMQESVYNGKNTKQATISKNYGHTWCYLYEFGTDNDAKRNMEYWANQETDNNIKPEYIVNSSRNYQKYVIDEGQYVILIRRDNYVFYGIGHSQYREELDEIVNIIEEEMK